MHRQDQRGIALVIEIILIVVVMAVLGFVGYRVFTANQSTENSASSTSSIPTAKTWKAAGYAVKGTYADADIVQVSDTLWRLYYAIQPEVQGNGFEVYSATSSDGKTWTQEAGTRKTMATFPHVIKLSDGRYRMYFQSAGTLKSAISSDGLNFSDEPGTRIDTANSEGLTLDNVAAPTTIQLSNGTYVMLYRATINQRYASNTPNPTTSLLMWATSPDGLAFTKRGIAMDSRNATLAGQLDGPSIVKWDDGQYKIFVTSYTGVYEFSFDGKSTFGEPELALAGETKKTSNGFEGSPPGDPTLAKIDGTWYMYYGGPRNENGIHYATLQ